MAQKQRLPGPEADRLTATFLAIRQYVIQHRTMLLLGAAAVIVVIVVSTVLANSRARTRYEIETRISEALFLMQGMQHQTAALELESVLERHPRGPLLADLTYHTASAQFMSASYDRAQQLFESFLDLGSDDPHRVLAAREGIADCHQARAEFAAAARLYENLASDPLVDGHAAMLLAQSARSYERAGDFAAMARIGARMMDEFADNEEVVREGTRLVTRAQVLKRGTPE